VVDAIRTAGGMVYSVLTEEILLAHLPEINDCVVVAAERAGEVCGRCHRQGTQTQAPPGVRRHSRPVGRTWGVYSGEIGFLIALRCGGRQ
jgi:hypothetical protein